MKDIVCQSGVALLMDYLEDALPVEQRAAIDRHVAGCPRCLAFISSYRETPRILRQATIPEFPADLELSLRRFLHSRLDKHGEQD